MTFERIVHDDGWVVVVVVSFSAVVTTTPQVKRNRDARNVTAKNVVTNDMSSQLSAQGTWMTASNKLYRYCLLSLFD